MPNPPAIIEGRHSAAFYTPATDTVDMPARRHWKSETAFFKTLFHELVHSTGHQSRLARPTLLENCGINSTGESRKTYSKEELIAEMGAAFLAAMLNIHDTSSVARFRSLSAKLAPHAGRSGQTAG